jgi:hypothetical protein
VKKKRFTVEQIVSVLKEAELGTPVSLMQSNDTTVN